MKACLDCFPCFLRQTLHLARLSNLEEQTQKKIVDFTGSLFTKIDMNSTSPEIAHFIHSNLKDYLKNDDPYAEIKATNVAKAQTLLPKISKILTDSSDKLLTAARLAIAGNVIDLGACLEYDMEKEIKSVVSAKFAIDDFELFRQDIQKAKSIIYLGDNTAEGVFDKIFIEQINKPVTYATREIPVINDITVDWAKKIGIDEVATVVSSGAKIPGTVPKFCSPEFRKKLENADLIISKGQGNYEALSDTDLPIYFFLKAKCQVIADHIGLKIGSYILMKNNKDNA